MSGVIKSKLGFYGNFGLGIAMILICLAYTVFFLKVTNIYKSLLTSHCNSRSLQNTHRRRKIKTKAFHHKKVI